MAGWLDGWMELIDADTDEDEIEDKDGTTGTKTSEDSFIPPPATPASRVTA